MNSNATTEMLAEPGFAARLTAPPLLTLAPELRRLGAGLALSALYGLALGARESGVELARHALGAPLGLAILGALLTPSLIVLFALFDAPLTPRQLFALLARALSSAGLALAGVAPATALFVVTVESGDLVSGVARAGAALAGGLALGQLTISVWARLADAPAPVRRKARALLLAYGVFVSLLGARLFSVLLPVVGGAP